MESLPQPTASFFFQLPTKVKNQCESLKKESAQRTESQAKAPGCRLRKKLPLGKDLLPGFARLFFLGQTVLEANNRVAGHLLTFILHHKPSAEDLMLLEDDWVWILAFPKQDLLAKKWDWERNGTFFHHTEPP